MPFKSKKYLVLAFFIFSNFAFAINSSENMGVWNDAAEKHDLDPLLLLSVALKESKLAIDSKFQSVSPWPWALNHKNLDVRFYKTKEEAVNAAAKLFSSEENQSKSKRASIDVGLMQINWKWHKEKIGDRSIGDLLDPMTNINMGASILSEAMRSSPDDLVLGVGRYHSWTDSKARAYGQDVLDIYQRILNYCVSEC